MYLTQKNGAQLLMKSRKAANVAPAHVCSDFLGQRVVYHKKTLATVTEKALTSRSDLQSSSRLQATLQTVQIQLNKKLLQAVKRKRIPQIARLIAQGADINAVHGGLSPLHHAVMLEDVELVVCLITNGANPNLKGHYGNTPLHEAALNTNEKKIKILDLLLFSGANPNIQNELGQTPLHFHRGNTPEHYEQIARLLIRAGAELHISDIRGNEPLEQLAESLKGTLIQFALHCRFGR